MENQSLQLINTAGLEAKLQNNVHEPPNPEVTPTAEINHLEEIQKQNGAKAAFEDEAGLPTSVKDQDKTNPHKENMITEVPKWPRLELLKQCLEEKVVGKNTYPPQINKDRILEIARQTEVVPEKDSQNESPVQLADEVTMQQQAQRAVRDAISIIHDAQLVDLDVLVEASKSAGPGNTHYIEDQNVGYLNSQQYMEHIKQTNNGKLSFPLPPPETKQVRNDYMRLEIGGGVVKFYTDKNHKLAAENNLPLSPDQALALTMVEIATHEYAHALDHALELRGIITKNQGLLITNQDYPNLDDFLAGRAHNERFARGIEEIVMRGYMTDRLGITRDQVAAFFDAKHRSYTDKDSAVKNFFQWTKEKGYKPMDIAYCALNITSTLQESLGDNARAITPDLERMLCYGSIPYTETQVRSCLQKAA